MIEIVKWSDTFENADTRKRQRLGWFLSPSGCDSKGFRKLMRMGNEGLRCLGFFQAICQSLATMGMKSRKAGTFLNSDDSMMEFADILELSRLGGMEVADCRQITGRLVAVGWLKLHKPLEIQQSATCLPPVCHQSPGFVKGEGEGEGEGEDPPKPPRGNAGGVIEELPLEPKEPANPKPTPIPKARCLPENWKRMTTIERKQTKVLQNTPAMETIGSWFGRRPGTLWTIAEAAALLAVNPLPEEIRGMGVYYSASIDRPEDIRRRDLITLLNNWSGELDRARSFVKSQSA